MLLSMSHTHTIKADYVVGRLVCVGSQPIKYKLVAGRNDLIPLYKTKNIKVILYNIFLYFLKSARKLDFTRLAGLLYVYKVV